MAHTLRGFGLPLLCCLLASSACRLVPETEDPASADRASSSSAGEHVEVPLEPYAGRLRQVTVGIAGRERPLLFDTGGGLTLIQPDVADLAGCTPHGRITGWRMNGERVEFRKCGRVPLGFGPSFTVEREVAVFDLMALLPDGLPALAGLVSLHTFQDHPMTLDLARNRLTVETEASLASRTDDMRELRLHVERDMGGRGVSAFIETEARTGRLRLLIDSGNLAGVILAPHALVQLGPAARESADAERETELHIVGLGPVRTSYVVDDITHDGVVGAEFLERMILTMDLRRERGWARWSDPAE